MAKYVFNLEDKAVIDEIRSPIVYQFNMAMNLALLSNDTSVIRRFFRNGVWKYTKDVWIGDEVRNTFLQHYEPGQAFVYFGLIPMIVQGKVNLIASNGFECKSNDLGLEKALNKAKEIAELEKQFVAGAYFESGLGDFAYRVVADPSISEYPILNLVEPQHLEVNYKFGKIKSFVVKEVSIDDPSYELCEIHSRNKDGYATIEYKFRKNGKYVLSDDDALIEECRSKFPDDLSLKSMTLPIKGFTIIYKQNESNNMLYKSERGVPDIQGLLPIEDGLCEVASDLVDAIRKAGVKEWVSDELLPEDVEGNKMQFDPFRKTIITTKGSSTPGESQKLITLTQGQINWEAYTRTIQNLMSIGINKAGLSPTTLGITGLESINSSQESQDAREKPSLRKREICLNGWEKTLKETLNLWLQVYDYMRGYEIVDYTDLINIQFNEYTNPSLESVTDVLVRQVAGGIKSKETAISELNDGWSDEQVQKELQKVMAESTPTLNENKVVDVQDNIN